jgi:SAM-dependent methyltransferase
LTVAAPRRDLFIVSALFLFLELAFIRWLPAQVLFLTFFTNTVLLASFLGLSLGCLAARRRMDYLPLTPLLLAVAVGAGSAMEWIRLALQDIIDVGHNKVSPQMVFFGAEVRVHDVTRFAIPIELVAGAFFLLVAATMVGLGQLLGRRFAAISNPIHGYMVNIGGSLAGVLLFQACSWWLQPAGWFALVAAGLIYFLFRDSRRRWWAMALSIAAPLLVLLPDYLPTGVIRTNYPEEYWSPYYRINYSPKSRVIVTNLIGHQNMVSRTEPAPAYAIPYLVNRDSGQPPFHDILIIGAGSGNDLSRALQWTAPDAHIDAVEIDPVIQEIGDSDHPDKPYRDRRVSLHLGDGRNFLRSTQKKYDLVVFALIDSLVLHSSVSNIRLESYLFTKESMQDVQRRLKPGGVFVMYNYFRQGWIVSRLNKTLEEVFPKPVVVLTFPQEDRIAADARAEAFTLFFAGPRASQIDRAFRENGPYTIATNAAPGPATPNGFHQSGGPNRARLSPAAVEIPEGLRVAEDAWPFLYLRNPMIPDLSWRGMTVLALISFGLLWAFGWRLSGSNSAPLNGAMLLLGAGFMLLETKAVVHMALVFGSTWVVNTAVFAVILVMILLANVWVLKAKRIRLPLHYAGLLVSLALNVVIPLDSFLGFPPLVQGIAAGALVLSPVFFAGVVFATLFRTAEKPEQALAYNTAGAILGGLAESLSLLIGFKYLVLVAAAMYIASGGASFSLREASASQNTRNSIPQ